MMTVIEIGKRDRTREMGVPKEQAARNRQTIIDTASRVFRERGVDGVGVADLMKEAGFTHGGFYNHFASKDSLAGEACASVFATSLAGLQDVIAADAAPGSTSFRAVLEAYLSPGHCDRPGAACPVSTLAADVARQGGPMQAAYAEGIEQFLQAFACHFARSTQAGLPPEEARRRAIGLLGHLVGTIVLARGVGAADPRLAEEILAEGRRRLPT